MSDWEGVLLTFKLSTASSFATLSYVEPFRELQTSQLQGGVASIGRLDSLSKRIALMAIVV